METFLPKDNVYKLLFAEIGPDAPQQGLPSQGEAEATPELVAAYITTFYYSALSNLYLQGLLPKDFATIGEEMPRFKIAFDRTYADFTAASKWLKEHQELVEASPAKGYYDEIQAMGEAVVIDISAAYSQA